VKEPRRVDCKWLDRISALIFGRREANAMIEQRIRRVDFAESGLDPRNSAWRVQWKRGEQWRRGFDGHLHVNDLLSTHGVKVEWRVGITNDGRCLNVFIEAVSSPARRPSCQTPLVMNGSGNS